MSVFFFSLPGVKKALGKYGPADVEDTTGAATDSKDDDDIDLFGSDDEEVLTTFLYYNTGMQIFTLTLVAL